MIDVPETDRLTTPPSRRNCPGCEATSGGCRGHKFLSGRWCCATCETRAGDHDRPSVTCDDAPRATDEESKRAGELR